MDNTAKVHHVQDKPQGEEDFKNLIHFTDERIRHDLIHGIHLQFGFMELLEGTCEAVYQFETAERSSEQ